MSTTRLVTILFGLTAFLSAQPTSTKPPASSKKPQSAPAPEATEQAAQLELVHRNKIPYQPALVRDPFASPTDNSDRSRMESLDEIGIKGRLFPKNGKPMAVVSDSRGRTRLLPVGYRFKDGEIIAITERAVIFRQWDPTSTNHAVSKTVEKPFKREEGKP